jgi:hypothetical protein
MNRNGIKPESLKNDAAPAAPEFVTAVGDDAINRFDETRKKKKKKRSGNKGGQSRPAESPAEGQKKEEGSNEGQKKHNHSRGRRNDNRKPGKSE